MPYARHHHCRARGEHGGAIIDVLATQELARQCKEETGRYLRREPYVERFCFELFRRAIAQRDDEAWAVIYEQYAGIVRRWLGPSGEVPDEAIAAAFERFWRAVDAEKFGRFASLSTVLQYLKMCALTGKIDRARAARQVRLEESLDDSLHALPSNDDVQKSTEDRLDAADFWKAVQRALVDEREQLVVYLSYVVGQTPREILGNHQHQFSDVADIYRLKRNALDKLRRRPEVLAFR